MLRAWPLRDGDKREIVAIDAAILNLVSEFAPSRPRPHMPLQRVAIRVQIKDKLIVRPRAILVATAPLIEGSVPFPGQSVGR